MKTRVLLSSWMRRFFVFLARRRMNHEGRWHHGKLEIRALGTNLLGHAERALYGAAPGLDHQL